MASSAARAGKGAEYRMSGYNEIGAMNFAEGFLLAGGQADFISNKLPSKQVAQDRAALGGSFMLCEGWAGHCCLSDQGYNRYWYGRGRQAGSAPRWGYPACRSRNWSSRPVYISDTPQHPFAIDHDPPADPGYVDTWCLPQRLYSR